MLTDYELVQALRERVKPCTWCKGRFFDYEGRNCLVGHGRLILCGSSSMVGNEHHVEIDGSIVRALGFSSLAETINFNDENNFDDIKLLLDIRAYQLKPTEQTETTHEYAIA